MSDHELTGDEIKKLSKKYWGVFFALIVLTVVTVLASYVEGTVVMTLAIGLAIACTKGTLVAGYFMHLFHESKLVYWILAVMTIFFFVLLLIPVLADLGSTNTW